MHLVGLTGGIGSGKTTVATRLRELGAHIVDADVAARAAVEPGGPALEAVVARFGDDVLDVDGRLDRAALAALVFADAEARADLEALIHPHVAAAVAEQVADHLAAERDESRPRLVVVDHPLLIETGQVEAFADLVVVLASEQVRVERLVAARGMSDAEVRARIRAQVSDEQRRAAATHLIVNDGDLASLERETDAVHARLRAVADRV